MDGLLICPDFLLWLSQKHNAFGDRRLADTILGSGNLVTDISVMASMPELIFGCTCFWFLRDHLLMISDAYHIPELSSGSNPFWP